MSLLLEIGIGAAIVLNSGLLWSIASKVGCLDGKMGFVVKKIEEHNNLVTRVTILETKENMREQGHRDPGSVEQGC